MNELTQRLLSERQGKRETFIKEMLIKKGHLMIVDGLNEMVRFPKINRTLCDGWEYIFVDNNTKQGEFIVALGPWEDDTKFDFSMVNSPDTRALCTTTSTFKWQDTDFDAARL